VAAVARREKLASSNRQDAGDDFNRFLDDD
jgi:hypothetical protein